MIKNTTKKQDYDKKNDNAVFFYFLVSKIVKSSHTKLDKNK